MDIKPYPVAALLVLLMFNAQATAITTGQDSFEFHGYFRGGLGFSEAGTNQSRFQAPGTRSAFRLGNEPDTNLELQLTYNYEIDPAEGSHVQGIFMLDGYKAHGESNEFSVDHLAQTYLSFNGFMSDNSKLWLGRRYYERKNIYISDHTWLNPGQNSQNGIGLEDISAGNSKLNIALFRYEDNFELTGSSYLLNSSNLDLRWHDISFGNELSFTAWAALSQRHKNTSLGYQSESGYGLGGWLDGKPGKLKHTTALLYQTGPSITQGDYNARPVREDQGWDLANASAIEINHTRTHEVSPDYSLQWTILARQEDRGTTGHSTFNWLSIGARPVFYFSAHRSLAIEVGVDAIDDKINDVSGSLSKLSGAYQFSAKRGFFSRPVLRLFITFANWSDELRGLVGNSPGDAPYANETQGWSLGTQVEAWW